LIFEVMSNRDQWSTRCTVPVVVPGADDHSASSRR
jgi:hypothetical protein